MAAESHSRARIRSAAAIVRLLQPGAWIPAAHASWRPVVEELLGIFLRHFDGKTLARLLAGQQTLPASTPPAARMASLASELTALHKVCQMLARQPALPEEVRARLTPLERLPAEAIPAHAFSNAVALAARARPELRPDPDMPGIGRGSVADVFRFQTRAVPPGKLAFKTVRADASQRIRREAVILAEMADESGSLGAFAGPGFARTLAEALRDAGAALLREIDFPQEWRNLRDARAFYQYNDRVCIPVPYGEPLGEGLFMEFAEGSPLPDIPLNAETRRRAARLVFRSLLLEPLFSGLPETIFHADPHAGNILARLRQNGELTLVLLDWSQAGRLSAPLRRALLELCLGCMTGGDPPPAVLAQIVETDQRDIRIALPREGDPLHKAFAIVERLAMEGHPVPVSLLLLRKAFLTLDGITRQLDPDFGAWREMLAYGAWMLAGEAPFRAWSLALPWLDQPAFYRSGLPTRKLAGVFFETGLRKFVQTQKTP